MWARVASIPSVGDAAQSPDLPTPELRYSLDVNALNFCAFSLHDAGQNALIAVPNLIESSVVGVLLCYSHMFTMKLTGIVLGRYMVTSIMYSTTCRCR